MNDGIAKRWIVCQRPGEVPFKKVPKQSNEGVIEMLEEMQSLEYYKDAVIIIAELTTFSDLWVRSIEDYLCGR